MSQPKGLPSAVDQLGRDIVVGEYGEANPFREAELAAKIGVGRSVLREAVKILGAKGLLAGRRRHGTWVPSEEHCVLPSSLRDCPGDKSKIKAGAQGLSCGSL